MIWGVATHERNRASFDEISESWSLSQLIDAHLALGVFDELQERQAEKVRRDAELRQAQRQHRM